MTFIISAATKNAVFQIADTRLTTPDGSLFDDEAVKTVIVHCYDAKLSISYSGMALINGKRTDQWIEDKLTKFKAWHKVFQEIVEFMKGELTNAIRGDRNLERYGLTIDIVGLGVSPAGVRQPAVAIITNATEPQIGRNQFKIVDSKGRPFSQYILTPKFQHYIGINGAVGPSIVINGLRRKIEKQLRRMTSLDDLRPIMDRLVAILRLHRQDRILGRVIGNYCLAVAIRSDFTTIVGSYGPKGKSILRPRIVQNPNT